MAASIVLRPPTTSSSTSLDFTPPPVHWLSGTWHVTHSTLPMWKNARNVTITYDPYSISSVNDIPKLLDTVSYQSHTSDKIKTIVGVDSPAGPGAWNWRGKGWLMIASSHWEVLGFGGTRYGDVHPVDEIDKAREGQWVVTFFEKTLFTPAGIDIYSRRKEGLSEEILEGIMRAIRENESEIVRTMAGKIFEVRNDLVVAEPERAADGEAAVENEQSNRG